MHFVTVIGISETGTLFADCTEPAACRQQAGWFYKLTGQKLFITCMVWTVGSGY